MLVDWVKNIFRTAKPDVKKKVLSSKVSIDARKGISKFEDTLHELDALLKSTQKSEMSNVDNP